ncbi:MAG: ABC transporter ATP-binding protein [Planctomycetes bacterium RBG_16_43_13]|nr:MAG: ABC transporter ATP-binding protein [Planctomycetes bacterium RBG_16_43_13]
MSNNPKQKTNVTQPPFFSLLRRLWQHISRHRRYQFILMLVLTLASSCAEVVSLGAVLPFIGILTQPDKVFNFPLMAGVIQALGIASAEGLVLPLTIAFAVAALITGGLRLLLLWVSIRLANATGIDLSNEIYRRTLYQPYRVHIARNSSEIISGITQKVGTATSVLMSLLTVVSSAALFAAILLTLLAIDPMVTTVTMTVFGAAYGIVTWLTRYRLVRNSQCIAHEQTQVIKALQEGLGGIRDVLLDGAQAVYCGIYRKAVQRLQWAWGENTFISQGPRYAMETLGMVLVAALAYGLTHRPGGIGAALPVLGVLALGAQRLLPLMQLLYGHSTVISGSHASLTEVLDLLDQPLPEDARQLAPAPLKFEDTIRFDNVRFRYNSDSPWVLDGINLTIHKGARIGFVGSTGSGKSTALDLLMFLLEPTQGKILVDDQPISGELRRAWQRTIAHVPQSIFLADTTIAENIAFGVPPEQIDLDRVRQAADQAQIAEFIESLPEAYSAFVGERGIRLSGGQRQRIGIARSLYKQATVIIFDEATSALDSVTEKAVMRAIENLNRDLTILIIAHRLTTLQHCDTIVQLGHGQMVAQGSYEYFMNSGSDFQSLVRTEA